MYGRLGNQFFRYAVARALQKKYYSNEKIVINFQQVNDAHKEDESFYNVLEDFNVSEYCIYQKKGKVIFNETNFFQKILCFFYYMGMRTIKPEQMIKQSEYEKKWIKILSSNGIYWFRRGSWALKKSAAKNKFLSGNFEDPKYFNDIREILMKEFTPKHPVLPKNMELLQLINSTNSVCLSVRRGDFETNTKVKKLQSVCHQEYFKQAIEVIKTKVKNPTFFLFSDDIKWVRENIKTDCPTYYEDGTDPVWEKLRLMSSCKHFIISNSTFSWWVQYLSPNKNKIVVSPNRWYNNNYDSPLINKEWILISV